MHVTFEAEESEGLNYLRTCARIRKISVTSLMHRLIDTIGQDQLVASVLDDADNMITHRKGEHRCGRAAA